MEGDLLYRGIQLVVVLLVIGAVGGLVVWMVRAEKHRKQAKIEVFSRLGFTEVLPPPPEMLARLESLYRTSPKQKFDLRQLFEKSGGKGYFYIFDLVETSGDDNTYLGDNAVLVVSPELHLPRARVAGRMSFEGKASGWMVKAAEKFLGWAANQGGYTRMDLSANPELDKALMVVFKEVDQSVLDYLTPQRLARLTWLGDMQNLSEIQLQGDMFVLSRAVSPRKPDLETQFSALAAEADGLWDALR